MKHFALWALCILLAAPACSSGHKEIEINPSVRYEGNRLFVSNQDDFDYEDVKITINDGAYAMILDASIIQGSLAVLDLRAFSKADGERFNISRYAIKDVSILCKAVRRNTKFESEYLGTAFYHGTFKG